MADFFKKEYGVEVELKKGSGGIFDINVDGKLIYSKNQTGQFPTEEQIRNKMKELN